MASAIKFFTEQVKFRPPAVLKLKSWITAVIRAEHKAPGEINYIFCSDSFLADMNRQYLQHDTLTDIITFDNSESSAIVEGDIFLSVDRIHANAAKYEVPFETELHRVMIHGVLHLIGYDDKTAQEKRTMRKKEDAYLSLRGFTEK